MESLIARVLLLPVAVIGDHVLSFLSIPDMVRFDSAVAQKRYRRSVEEAFVCVTVQLKLARPHQAQYQRNVWRWCIKRAVTVAEVIFAELDAEEDVKLLLEILHRVPGDGIVGWHCMMRVVGTRVVRSTLSNSELKSRINRVDVLTVYFPAIPGLWEEQSGAQEELDAQEVEPEALSELQVGQADQGLPSILLGCKSMREIWLFRCAVLSLATVEALCSHALVSLSLHATRKCTPELLSVIGNVCCNLRSLVIENGQGDEQWVTESGLISVARGCRKVASFAADYVDAVTESVLLVFAAHCPELDTLAFAGCATLTDAVLLALCAQCPLLFLLSCGSWAITSVGTIDAAEPLLSRLVRFPIHCTPEANPAAVVRAVALLRTGCIGLTISGMSPAHVGALCHGTLRSCYSVALSSSSDEIVPVDDLILKVANGSVQLERITLSGGCTMSEATLLSLPALCPNLTNLVAHSIAGAVTERTFIALLDSCPQLRGISICRNIAFTDALLRVIAHSYLHVVALDLTANTYVSERAILELVATREFLCLQPPAVFTAEATMRILGAVHGGEGFNIPLGE
jgi:hypothetical protein